MKFSNYATILCFVHDKYWHDYAVVSNLENCNAQAFSF